MNAPSNFPAVWPALRKLPDIGTIVHITGMAHLTQAGVDAYDLIPGGTFAEVVNSGGSNSRANDDGDLMITTVPRALPTHPRYSEWVWSDTFPVSVSGLISWGRNSMKLELPPQDVQDAVRAFVALHDRPDNMPIVVDDGWLC